MRLTRLQKKKHATGFRGGIGFPSRIILLCMILIFHQPGGLIGLQIASANRHYGIQGQPAPELNLSGWIDGDGNSIAPIHLNNYRGKVVYLYFFQDW